MSSHQRVLGSKTHLMVQTGTDKYPAFTPYCMLSEYGRQLVITPKSSELDGADCGGCNS